jgi:hypothetical protein
VVSFLPLFSNGVCCAKEFIAIKNNKIRDNFFMK